MGSRITNPMLYFSPKIYAGEESITFPNGLILKHGYTARTGDSMTVTFSTAFPTGVISAQVTGLRSVGSNEYAVYVKSLSVSQLVVHIISTYTGFYWEVWGY